MCDQFMVKKDTKKDIKMYTGYRKVIMVFVDLLFINISIFLAFMIRFDWNPSSPMREACVFYLHLRLCQ